MNQTEPAVSTTPSVKLMIVVIGGLFVIAGGLAFAFRQFAHQPSSGSEPVAHRISLKVSLDDEERRRDLIALQEILEQQALKQSEMVHYPVQTKPNNVKDAAILSGEELNRRGLVDPDTRFPYLYVSNRDGTAYLLMARLDGPAFQAPPPAPFQLVSGYSAWLANDLYLGLSEAQVAYQTLHPKLPTSAITDRDRRAVVDRTYRTVNGQQRLEFRVENRSDQSFYWVSADFPAETKVIQTEAPAGWTVQVEEARGIHRWVTFKSTYQAMVQPGATSEPFRIETSTPVKPTDYEIADYEKRLVNVVEAS